MSSEIVFFPSAFALSLVGIYLNLCYLRATHRSTVYARFLGRNMRFLSVAHIFLASSNIIFTAAIWGSGSNRSRKSEAFFSTTLALTRALPSLTVFWVTVERLAYNRLASIREATKFRYVAIFRVIQITGSVAMELALRTVFEPVLEAEKQEKQGKETSESAGDEVLIKNSLVANYYCDYLHATLFFISFMICLIIFNVSRGSYTRAGLLGGMRNDQKIQNLASQLDFFKSSYLPLFVGCFADYLVQLIIKRGTGLDDATVDVLYIASRTFLPIIYPLSLIACHRNLRIDYIANILLCRKARNMHKESKVKVIATRESQESIIANLKMIGILSDVDTMPPGGIPGLPQMVTAGGRPMIAKDPMSSGSMGSVAKSSTAPGTMMFTTRPKHSVPSMGSVG